MVESVITKWRQNLKLCLFLFSMMIHTKVQDMHSYILPLLQVLQLKRQKMADWPWWKMGKCFVQNAPKRIRLGKVGHNIIMKCINKISKPLVKFAIEFSKINEAEIITTVNSTRSQLQPWRIQQFLDDKILWYNSY